MSAHRNRRIRWYEIVALALLGLFFVSLSFSLQSYNNERRAQREACTRSGFVDTVYVNGTAYCVLVHKDSTELVKSPWYLMQQENRK